MKLNNVYVWVLLYLNLCTKFEIVDILHTHTHTHTHISIHFNRYSYYKDADESVSKCACSIYVCMSAHMSACVYVSACACTGTRVHSFITCLGDKRRLRPGTVHSNVSFSCVAEVHNLPLP